MSGLLGRLARRVRGDPGGQAPAAPAPSDAEPAASVAQAVALHRSGRLADADAIYRRVLAADPLNPDALHMAGVVAQQQGDAERAVDLMQRAAAVAPNDASVRCNLGVAQIARGQFAEAESSLRAAVGLRPDWDRAHANLGVALRHRGDVAGAEQAFAAAHRLNPANVEALRNLATLFVETGRHDDAEPLFQRALALRPEDAELWDSVGAVHMARHRFAEAERCFRSALAFDAGSWRAHSNLGFVLLQQGRADEAEQACRAALALSPEFPGALVNLASILRQRGDTDGAARCLQRALAADPSQAAAHVNLGSLHAEQGRAEAGEACFREALRLDPRSVPARYNLAMLRLQRGDYREGFALFEGRFDAFPAEARRPLVAPIAVRDDARWRGDPLAARRLLVWCEQGYGDCLMMLRYLPLLKTRGAGDVSVLCEPALERICRAVPGVDRVLTRAPDADAGAYDVHCPIMSLPHLFGTTVDTIPVAAPFAAPPPLAQAWRERLAATGARRIGLAWTGSRTLRDDARRSIALALLDPLRAVPGVRLVSLQKGDAAAEAAGWGADFTDPIAACDDFMDTAALVANLDLVISVDTAVIHLAGVLGKPAWLLNRYESEWRWGSAGERSAWYPSLRIFRQPAPFEWAPVIRSVCQELRASAPARA